MSTLKITIVADDPLVRAGLASMLAEQAALQVVSQFSVADFLNELEEEGSEPTDVLVWDVGWDGGEETVDWQTMPYPVIALVPEDGSHQLYWQAGVAGLLRREATAVQIVTAVQAAQEKLHTFDPSLNANPFDPIDSDLLDIQESLTPRETEVLQLIAEGHTNKAIAQRLEISNHTVKFHVTAIMTKLNAQSRTNAVVRATRLGLLTI